MNQKNNQINPKTIALIFGILVLLFVIGFYAMGWREPGVLPPGGNVAAPINIGTEPQRKQGIIGATRFESWPNSAWFVAPAESISAAFHGNVGIGTTGPADRFHIRGGHNDSRFRLEAHNAPNPPAHLAFWASEPGISWAGTGIGNNVTWQHAAGSWGPRLIDTTHPGSYIRFYRDTTRFGTVNTANIATERMIIDAAGNVGIGTATPSNLQGWGRVLDVFADPHAKLLVRSSAVKTGIFSHNTWWPGGAGKIGTESSHPLALMAGYGNFVMTLTTAGNVGIGGTTGPFFGRLMIEDSAVPIAYRETGVAVTAGGLWRQVLDGGAKRFDINTAAAGDFSAFITPFFMHSAGNVGIGTTAPGQRLHVHGTGDDFVRLSREGQAQIWDMGVGQAAAPGTFFIARAGIERVFNIDTAGRVGIGTTGPTQRLDIEGQIRIRGGGPALGRVLTSAADGTAIWTDLPAGVESGWRREGTVVRLHTITDNVGIGTPTPDARLRVSGGGATFGSAATVNNADGSVSLGHTGLNYTPTTANWAGAGTTLLLGALDHSTIGFHDSGARVDFIRAGAGTIQLGFNAGWGEANIGMPGSGIWNSAGNVGIGTTAPGHRLDVVGAIRAQGADLRTTGNTGWLNETHGGGWFMQDTTWVRTHGGRSVWTGGGLLGSDGGLTVGYGGHGAPAGGAIIAGNVGIGTIGPDARLRVSGGGATFGSAATVNNADGSVSLGHTGLNYTPTTANWAGAGTTLLLGALDHSTIGFHDAGARVDFIRAGAGTIQLGFNAGWGEANIGMPGSGIWSSAGNVGIGTTAPTRRLDVRGDVIANAYFHHSDRALKTEITPLENSLARILNLRPVSFRWKENNELSLGLVAQDIKAVFPEVVSKEGASGSKSVNYSAIIAPLIQAIQEQQAQIDQQQAQINGLKVEIENLKQK